MRRKIKIGFSPCPNDTFMFYALVYGKIVCDFEFEPVLDDVEELNQRALLNELDVSKVSFQTAGKILNHYAIFNSGAALGKGVGPLLVGKNVFQIDVEKQILESLIQLSVEMNEDENEKEAI